MVFTLNVFTLIQTHKPHRSPHSPRSEEWMGPVERSFARFPKPTARRSVAGTGRSRAARPWKAPLDRRRGLGCGSCRGRRPKASSGVKASGAACHRWSDPKKNSSQKYPKVRYFESPVRFFKLAGISHLNRSNSALLFSPWQVLLVASTVLAGCHPSVGFLPSARPRRSQEPHVSVRRLEELRFLFASSPTELQN